jgi:TolB protein
MKCARSRKFLSYAFALTVSLMVICQTPPAAARIYIDINSPLQRKIPIAIPAFKYELTYHPVGQKAAEILSDALSFSGLVQVLNPAVFLQDPQEMAVNLEGIKFAEWRFLGADLLVRGSYQVQGDRLRMTIGLFDVIRQELLLERTYEDNIMAVRRNILRYGDEMVLLLTGEAGIFQSQIAFIGDGPGNKELYLAEFDGTNIRQLTHDGSLNLSPDWSSDGSRLAYVSYLQGNPDLYGMNLITKAVRLISNRPGVNMAPAWHPKNNKLAATLSVTGNSEIYLLDERGKVLQRLTKNWSIDVSPSWSPDGQKLAYVSNRSGKPQIYILDMKTKRSRRLTFEGAYNTSPAWSPRGDRIAFSGMHKGRFNLFLIDPEGKNLRQLTGGAGNNENPCWSPDGRLILFQSNRHGRTTLWVMLANGRDQRKLRLKLNGAHTEPTWSPRLTRRVP